MGKGNRSRQDRAAQQVAEPSKNVKKNQKNKSGVLSAVLIAVVALILAAWLVISQMAGSGIFLRAKTAAKTDDFKITGTMMSYYVYSSYMTMVNYYYEIYGQLLGSTTSIDPYSILGIDPDKSLKKQVYDEENGQTWFDYFAETALVQVEQHLVYAQAAKEAGVALDEEDYKTIDDAVTELISTAKQYDLTLDVYLSRSYGKGVSEKDVRAVMELQTLATKYAQVKNDEFLEASTDDKVNAYYDENKNDFLTADYLSYQFEATKNADAENADEQYAADKAKIEADAAELAALTTAESFEAWVKDRFIAANSEAYNEKYYADYLKEAEGETDEEKAAAAQKKVEEKLAEDADASVAKLQTTEYKYEVTEDLGKWIFGEGETSAAAVNTTKVITKEDTEKGTITVTVYLLNRAASRNEDTTRTFTYLLLEKSNYAKEDAEKALADFRAGEMSSEALIKLGEEYEKKAACTTWEEVAQGSVGVEVVDEWLFAEERKAGDSELLVDLETTENSSTGEQTTTEYYIIIYLDEFAPAEWYITARDGQVEDEMENWYEEATKTYVVNINRGVVNDVSL